MVSEDVEGRRMAEYHGLFNQYMDEVTELGELSNRVDDLADGLKELKAGADERLAGFVELKSSLDLSLRQEIADRRKVLTTAMRKVNDEDYPAAYELLGDEAGEAKTIEEVTGEEFQSGMKYYANVAGTWLKNVVREASKVVTYPILGNADYKSRVLLQETMGKEWFDERKAAKVSCWTNIIPYTVLGATLGYELGLVDPGYHSTSEAAQMAAYGYGALTFVGSAGEGVARSTEQGAETKEKVSGSLIGSAISYPIRRLGECFSESVRKAKAEARAQGV